MIAAAHRPGVIADAVTGRAGVGTVVHARQRQRRLPARKLWIAFAVGAAGTIVVDDGARRALVSNGRSLLAAGVVDVEGSFLADDAVELATPDGQVFAKGLVRADAAAIKDAAGKRSGDLPDGTPPWVIHRDDLVVLPD